MKKENNLEKEVKSEEKEKRIDERRFDEVIFATIDHNQAKADELRKQNKILLQIYQQKEIDQGYEGYNIVFYETDNGVRYDIVKRECGFT